MGMQIAPGARLDDGLLEACVVEDRPVVARFRDARHLALGSVHRAPRMVMQPIRTAMVETEGEIEFHLDGEPGVVRDRADVDCPARSADGEERDPRLIRGLYFTSFIGIAASSDDRPWRPSNFTGGRSWNMKSHFQRSDGFDACSQSAAETGRANAIVVRSGVGRVAGHRRRRARRESRRCSG